MMNRRRFSQSLLAAPWILHAQPRALKARVKIDTERTIGDIDPKLYGNFIEHLGRCIYGGVFEEKSPLSDTNGFRRDVLDAAKKLHVTQLRWHRDQAIETEFLLEDKQFSGAVEAVEVNSPDIKAENNFDAAPVKPARQSAAGQGNALHYTFPPHSYTMLRARLV